MSGFSVKKCSAATVLFCCLVALIATEIQLSNIARANFMVSLPAITIDENGSIYPETELIAKSSQNMYSVTSDISQYVLVIKRSNIVLDGGGYCVNGTAMQGVGYNNVGLTLEGVSNVTVKNLEVCTFGDYCIKLNNCSECLLFNLTTRDLSLGNSSLNKLTESRITESFILGSNNQVTRNNITGHMSLISNNLVIENNISSISVRWYTTNNTIVKNNFHCVMNSFVKSGTNFWDDGTVGNYWKDYNGTDLDNDGIGDTPYVAKVQLNENGVISTVDVVLDNCPLMNPYVVPSLPPQTEQPDTPVSLLIAGISAFSIAGIMLLFYARKLKSSNFLNKK